MGTTTTTPLATILLLAAMNSGTVCLSLETNILPSCNATYTYTHDLSQLRDQILYDIPVYTTVESETAKINLIVAFSKNIVEHSKDIDSEFVEIVNNKFWDLI